MVKYFTKTCNGFPPLFGGGVANKPMHVTLLMCFEKKGEIEVDNIKRVMLRILIILLHSSNYCVTLKKKKNDVLLITKKQFKYSFMRCLKFTNTFIVISVYKVYLVKL